MTRGLGGGYGRQVLRRFDEGQVKRVFKSGVGVIRNKAIDMIRGEQSSGDTSDFADAFSKYSSQNLTFPLDIEAPAGANGNQGHYIQFFINEQTDKVLDLSIIQISDPKRPY